MKKILFYLILFLATSCFSYEYIFDEANVFGVSFKEKMNARLQNIHEKNGQNIFIVSLKSALNSPSLASIAKTHDKNRIIIALFPQEKRVYLGFSKDVNIRFARTNEIMPITQKKLSNAIHEGIGLYIFEGKYEEGVEQIISKIQEFFPYKQKRQSEDNLLENFFDYAFIWAFVSIFISIGIAIFSQKVGRILLSVSASAIISFSLLAFLEYNVMSEFDIHIYIVYALCSVVFLWVSYRFIMLSLKKEEKK